MRGGLAVSWRALGRHVRCRMRAKHPPTVPPGMKALLSAATWHELILSALPDRVDAPWHEGAAAAGTYQEEATRLVAHLTDGFLLSLPTLE